MFRQLTPHIYRRIYDHYTDRPNIALIRGPEGVLLYDAGNSGKNVEDLKQELMEAGLPLPDQVVLSHWHWDHSFGAAFWDVPIIASEETDRQLRRMTGWAWDDTSMEERIVSGEEIRFCTEMIRREYPDRGEIRVVGADRVFRDTMTVDLGGGVVCHLIRAGGPHAADSVICWVPSDGFLLLGDSNCKDLYGLTWEFDIAHEENFGPATAALPYDPVKVEAFLSLLDGLAFTHCLSGHSDPMTREELYRSLRF